ncbi:uncharacterized protein CBL_11359 [Carabus blaptoides fortunei]
MASVYHFICDAEQIISQIIEKDRELEELRNICQHAALQIQRVWRGHCARKMVHHLHASATVIQKFTRGYLTRKNIDKYIREIEDYRIMKYRNKMATRIQALWRGYWYRTRILNFKEDYATQKRIEKVNAELICRMQEEKEKANELDKEEAENACMDKVLYILFKLHHHLRTAQKEGIYSMHGKRKYSWIEKLLKTMQFTDYQKNLRKIYKKSYQETSEPELILKGKYTECEKAYYLRVQNIRKQIIQEPAFMQSKPFCLDTRIERKDESCILTKGKFTLPIKDILRHIDDTKKISETDFDTTSKMVVAKLKEPPYYVDFWNPPCDIHNLPGN